MSRSGGPGSSGFGDLIGSLSADGALDKKAVWAALGGTWGMVESTLPVVVFVVAQTFWRSVPISVGATGAVVLVLALIRLFAVKGSLQTVLSGAIGAGIGLAFALFSNDANNIFVPGFIINAAYAVVLTASVLVGHSLSGYLIGVFTGDVSGWRGDSVLRRANALATLVFAVPSFLRLFVLFPMWAAKVDVAVIGSVKLALGLPLTAVALLCCYVILRPVYVFEDAAKGADANSGR